MRPDYGFAFTGLCELLQGNEGEESQGGTGARLQVPTSPWILFLVVKVYVSRCEAIGSQGCGSGPFTAGSGSSKSQF